MSYTALYRKFRPDTFESVRGQDHIVTTLKNQIKADRIGHAYLLCGTRGTGKTTIAKIFAKVVNCENPADGSPCGECPSCKNIATGASLNVIEIDAASNNGVDNIREIRDEVAYSPTEGKYKVYIIDEVHMLSIGAFNALLKTLEEPPSYVIFILATTEAHKIPITILSRCQRYDLKRITIDTIADHLQQLLQEETVEVEERAIRYIAKKADGSMRDALSLLDQCIAFYLGEKLTYDHVLEVLGAVETEVFSALLRKILSRDVPGAIHTLEDLVMQGRELGQFVNDFTWYMRNLLLVKTSDNIEDVLDVSSENLAQLKEESEMADMDTLMRFIRIFSDLSSQVRYATQKRVLIEIALIKLCKPAMEQNLDSILQRLSEVESKLEKGVVPVAATAPIGTTAVTAEPVQEEERPKKKLVPAASEDLQRVKSYWAGIVGETTGGFKTMLTTAKTRYDHNNTDTNKLYVVFTNFLAERYARDPQGKELLEKLIADKIGKKVEVEMLMEADNKASGDNLSDISIDEIIEKHIHADIIIEEE